MGFIGGVEASLDLGDLVGIEPKVDPKLLGTIAPFLFVPLSLA